MREAKLHFQATPDGQMDIVKGAEGALKLYNENFELVEAAVTNVQRSLNVLGILKSSRAEKRRRRALLKMMSELAPGKIPSYVLEVDGFSDNELSELLQHDNGLFLQAVASVFDRDDVSDRLRRRLSQMKTAESFWVHSVWASMIEATDLNDQMLEEVGKEVRAAISENETGYRRMFRDANITAKLELEYKSVEIKYLEGIRDDLRRCAVTGAIIRDESSGDLLVFRRGSWFVEHHDLHPSSSGIPMKRFRAERIQDLRLVLTAWQELERLQARDSKLLIIAECLGAISGTRAAASALAPTVSGKVFKPDLSLLRTVNGSDPVRAKNAQTAIERTFHVWDTVLKALSESNEEQEISSLDLEFFSRRSASGPAKHVLERYKTQQDREIKTDSGKDGEAGIFATYVYATHGDHRVAEKYDKIFAARRICHRYGNSGNIVAVPYAEKVMMSVEGMQGTNVEYYNNQAFEDARETRILFLPAMLAALGLASNALLCEVLVHEFQENPLMVTDPLSQPVLATMRTILENRNIDVAILQQGLISRLGEPGHTVSRELIAILMRLGAKVDPLYANRACFYDLTMLVKEYSPGPINMKFTSGVTLHGLMPTWLVRSGLVHFGGKGGKAVTAKVDIKEFVRQEEPIELDEGMKMAVEASGEAKLVGPLGYFSGALHLELKVGDFPFGIPVRLRNAYAEGVELEESQNGCAH